MSSLIVKIDKEEFLKQTAKERSYMTFSAVQDLQHRMVKVEGRPWWNQSKSFLGGVVGGALIVLGKGSLWGS